MVDYAGVPRAFAREVEGLGGELRTGVAVEGISETTDRAQVRTPAGTFEARLLVSCAGLQSDRLAAVSGLRADVKIVPFRGEYYELNPPSGTCSKTSTIHSPIPPSPSWGCTSPAWSTTSWRPVPTRSWASPARLTGRRRSTSGTLQRSYLSGFLAARETILAHALHRNPAFHQQGRVHARPSQAGARG